MTARGRRAWDACAPDDDGPPVAEGLLRVSHLGAVPRILREHGVRSASFFAELGLEPRLLDDPRNEIRFTALSRLLAAAARRTRCPHFGLLAAQGVGLGALGIVGHLARCAPDVGTALRSLRDHLALRDRGAVVTFTLNGGSASLGYAIYAEGAEGAEGSDQIYDGAMAIASNALRELCGPRARPSQVLFSHRRPADPRPWRRVFEAPLHFDADRTALVFPASWLEWRAVGAEPALHRFLDKRVRELEARAAKDLVGGVRRALRSQLLGERVSVGDTARILSIHRRTLNRRLQALNTSVHDVAEKLRFEVARQLVGSTAIPLIEIAAALGYADASGFTRAFRRWSGSTPSSWRGARERARAGPAAGAR